MRRAFRQFRIYPLQSLLIVLATALGVAVITAVLATLNQSAAIDEDHLWQRQLTLQARSDDFMAFYAGSEVIPVREIGLVDDAPVTLTFEDLTAAREVAPSVDYAYVVDWAIFDAITEADERVSLEVNSATEDFARAARLELAHGSLPSSSDFAEGRSVIVLSERALRELALTPEVLGQTIRLADWQGEQDYTVVGILAPARDPFGEQARSLVPYRTPPWQERGVRSLSFAVADVGRLNEARAELTAFASRQWGERVSVSSGNLPDTSQLRLITLVIAAFASTALAAAALNIMNLMLARVLKRRHAIGVERALGATRRRILGGMLLESLTLGALGGLLGVAAGYLLHDLYNRYQLQFLGEEFAPMLQGFPWVAAPLGLLVALGVSLIFGVYPALQASRLRPVEALREVV
jgi:ABC-type antimicrobial peptide transport system permease subunit